MTDFETVKTLKTIAIIEDDVHIGDIIEESLHREGYQTCRAYSGTEAQYLLADDKVGKKPDLILLDLMLPGMTGEELLSRIQD
ncbi:MAG: response regulator, partial [Lachnospiraceae bacterium]|nr:response regulator [Lachnospiraceae bacterium]